MSDAPALLAPRFSAAHAWAAPEGDTYIIGVSAHAQAALGPLVYVDLPAPGACVARGLPCAMLESAKTASEVIAPLSGTVLAVNEAAVDEPELVNRAPLSEGWLLRIAPAPESAPLESLMDGAAYAAFLASEPGR